MQPTSPGDFTASQSLETPDFRRGRARRRSLTPNPGQWWTGGVTSHLLRTLSIGLLSLIGLEAVALEPVRISKDGSGFVLAPSGQAFQVWGVNYDHDASPPHGRLLEDYWQQEWETVRQDFQEIRSLGANTVRIHLQFARFMKAADEPDQAALRQLRRLLELAESTNLYLDLTGLGCYHKQDVPGWYDALAEADRWRAQAAFWSAVAQTCRSSPAVFCYDLMNEPVVGGDKPGEWVTGELDGYSFVQRITLTSGKRTPQQIASSWVDTLVSAIRSRDPDHLITVGVIPWAMVWPNAKPIFYSPDALARLDFVSAHFYPNKGEIDKALAALAVYDLGKPLVIEEMFPLHCSLAEMDQFLQQSRSRAEGWLSFYWGKTIEEYKAEGTPQSSAIAAWLSYFREQAGSLRKP